MMVAMSERVSTLEVRQRIGDLLNRVALRHDEFIIERKGHALAALVPMERLEQMRRFARREALELLARQKTGPAAALGEGLVMELAVEAQKWARTPSRRKPRGK